MSTVAISGDLDERTRRRGLNGLLVYTFFMIIGFAMLMPLVAVHFVNNLGMAAATVGGALALRQLTQQGLALAGGMLADRYGARPMICLGVAVRALGFASLAFADTLPLLFGAMVLAALGGALFEAPYQAAIAALTTADTRSRYYALSNWVGGVATTLGPLLGVALLRFDFGWVCLVAAGCFALNLLIALHLLPATMLAERPRPLREGLATVRGDRRYLLLVALLAAYWFTAVQINLAFPLLAQHLTGSIDSVGVMFALSAGLTVALQVHLVRWLSRWLSTAQVLILGVVLMALACGALGFVESFATFLGCVAVFALGAIMTRPTQQTLLADFADARALGTYLGVSSLSLAVGGALGQFTGGALLDIAATRGWSSLPWLVFAGVGLFSAGGLALLLRAPRAVPAGESRA